MRKKLTEPKRLALVALAAVCASRIAAAQQIPSRTPTFPLAPGVTLGASLAQRPETWGTANTSVLRIPAAAFLPAGEDGNVKWSSFSMSRWQVAGTANYVAPLQLPAGAFVLGLELDGIDQDPANDLAASFILGSAAFGSGGNFGGPTTSGSSGQQTVYYDLSGNNLTIDNVSTIYEIDVTFGLATSTNLRLASVAVYYRLQVSPAPATPTFGDVPSSNPYYQYIEALAAAGITGGCGGGNYCPNNPVTRAQMAVFLAKALGLSFP
jgi:hypothetical protein